jgi:hypothetical protein
MVTPEWYELRPFLIALETSDQAYSCYLNASLELTFDRTSLVTFLMHSRK